MGSVGWGCGGRHVISRVIGRLGGGWRGRVGDATDGRGWLGAAVNGGVQFNRTCSESSL